MRRRTLPLALAALAMTLAGCSASSQEAIEASAFNEATLDDPVVPIGPGSEMLIDTFEWGYEIIEGVAVDGPVTITLNNIGDAEHNIRIDGVAGEVNKVEAAGGEVDTDTLLLFGAPGGQPYTYYCDIPGHRAQGMEGELLVYSTVEEAESNPVQPEMG